MSDANDLDPLEQSTFQGADSQSDLSSEIWSTAGNAALSVIWGIDLDGLSGAQVQALVTATVNLQSHDPARLSALQEQVSGLASDARLRALQGELL